MTQAQAESAAYRAQIAELQAKLEVALHRADSATLSPRGSGSPAATAHLSAKLAAQAREIDLLKEELASVNAKRVAAAQDNAALQERLAGAERSLRAADTAAQEWQRQLEAAASAAATKDRLIAQIRAASEAARAESATGSPYSGSGSPGSGSPLRGAGASAETMTRVDQVRCRGQLCLMTVCFTCFGW